MTDFGFGSLVGKYEEYFGRRVTRGLLIIVGFAVVAAGVGAIWQWLISPLLAFFNTPVWGRSLASLVLTAAAIGLGIALSFSIGLEIEHWRQFRSAKKRLAEVREQGDAIFAKAHEGADRVIEHGNAVLEEARGLVHEFAEDRKKVSLLHRHYASGLRRLLEKGTYSDEEAEEIEEALAAIEADLDELLKRSDDVA